MKSGLALDLHLGIYLKQNICMETKKRKAQISIVRIGILVWQAMLHGLLKDLKPELDLRMAFRK